MPGNLNLKKSWHPGLMKNQKKIWDEEQNKLNEFKKIKQRNEELNDEKEKLELMKLQYGEDLKDLPAEEKLKLNKLNWMYDDPTVKNEAGLNEMSEEFLLGKSHVENILTSNKPFSVSNSRGIEQVLDLGKGKTIGKHSYDDPLSKIKSEQMKMRSKLKESSSVSRDHHRHRDSSHGISKHRSSHRSSKEKHHPSTHRDRGKSFNRHESDQHAYNESKSLIKHDKNPSPSPYTNY